MKKHIMDIPAEIKNCDRECEMCQVELGHIKKKSDSDRTVKLKGQPQAILSLSTILCFLGMHEECCKNYVPESEQFEVKDTVNLAADFPLSNRALTCG